MARKINQMKPQGTGADTAGAAAKTAGQEAQLKESMTDVTEGIQMLFAGYAKFFTGLSKLPMLGEMSLRGVPGGSLEQALEQPLEQETGRQEAHAAHGGADSCSDTEGGDSSVSESDAADSDASDAAANGTAAVETPAGQTADPAAGAPAAQNPHAGDGVKASNAVPITKDDLLREIQAKFKKDKKNQEKVRSILLAYGASGLSLLPEEKYADFLNDVRQL